ncbi:TIM-barrel domain-containing protein [Mangrovimonas futianensis]|uniref:TIM-barrel domain-containing protein n=1 Tax=Mangrovimonas futianensis TaxID=2895523 RepID=UPI001E62022A|nr:TIM-barrel domain-containing protein [Mangrovimonas futianensis]MCF1420382.1 DUF4968 domain-containing protein [Mangrovimonas futianensis]
MRKITIFIIAFLTGLANFAQVTILVNEIPDNTPDEASLYISGDFEGWSGGQESFKLQQKENSYYITFPKQEGAINFKFTLGSWETVECNGKGKALDNRSYLFTKEADTLQVTIEGWTHLFESKPESTALENVSVLSEAFHMPQLDRDRRVWVYLPPDYEESTESYPVVYMHDGQNLFDKLTSYSGEWEVDETMNQLFEERGLELIVIGVDNGGSKRLDEYSPWTNKAYGGGEGDAYLDFVVNTLKPNVDNHFRTLSDKSNTAIIGSSMGGLISHYAALKYPQTFGKVGVFSPAFWFAPEILDYTKKHVSIQNTKMYFLAGGKEGENVAFEEINETVQGVETVVSLLKEHGFPSKNILAKVEPEGKHNEQLWRNNFEETICWLFSEKIPKREFVGASVEGNKLNITVTDGTYLIEFYDSKVVETSFIPEGEVYNPQSHAVVLRPLPSKAQLVEGTNGFAFSNQDFQVKIQKEPFRISYWYQGQEVISERNGYQRNKTYETIQFGISQDEVLYGGGARALGMNRRGHRLELYNKAHYGYETHSELMNFTLPIVLSSKQYLLHFDNAPIGFLDLDSKERNTLTYETISGRKTYQIVVGDSWKELLSEYTNLTGRQPMLPRWALGNFSSRFGYHSQKEVLETIETFREENIPVDAIILDLYWFGKEVTGTMGNLAFDTDSFPNPKQMIKTLRDQKVETVLITEPFVLTTSNRWNEAVKADALAKDSLGNPYTYDFFFGNTGLIDVYSSSGFNWFKNIYKELLGMGVTGIWGDLGEPELHPSGLIHATGTADEVHNTYGHDWARLVQKAFYETSPNQRPFILMRAGYSGSQRYGMVPWSGDVNRTWGGLQSQPEIALQMGMQGLAYMHSDLGGFANPFLDDELYARWLQYGVFQPVFRPHAQEEVASEPIFRSENAKKLAKEAIELRYQLLPYNYNLVYQNHSQGLPLMRALFFEEPENDTLRAYSETYLWGDDILVSPVLEANKKEQEVYFPRTSNWFDFYTDKKYLGGTTETVPLKENGIPTFVRGGSFITMAKPMTSTKGYDGSEWVVHFYYDDSVEDSHSEIYTDDGKTLQAFEKEEYELIAFRSKLQDKQLVLSFETKHRSQTLNSKKQIELVLHNIEKKPKQLRLNGAKTQFQWSEVNQSLTLRLDWDTHTNQKIELNLK